MTGTIFLAGVIFLVLAGAAILWPFLMSRQVNLYKRTSAAELEDMLHRFVTSVRDLDFDYDTGKIAEADYIEQRKLLIGRGVSTLKRLDETLTQSHHIDDDIEAMITAYRKKNAL